MARVLGHRRVLLSLLLASFVLRVVLALCGGEFYWPDEGRYGRAMQLLDYLSAGQFRPAFELLTSPLPHNGIALFALPSACVAAATRWLQIPIPTLSVAAAALSITSVTSIGIVFLLARKRGADQTEALVAAALMACSTSMFYYSRHLLPYDSAMALALFASLVGSAPALWRAFACGLCAFLAVFTYNGYWVLAGTAVLLHLLWHRESIGRRAVRSLVTAAGLLLLPAVLIANGGTTYYYEMKQFSYLSRTQGDPAEGWFFPWEYFWHAEHLLLLVWAIGLLAALVIARGKLRRDARIWVLAVLWIYFALAYSSAGLGIFGIFGRQVRQMVPFLCLVTAAVHSALTPDPLYDALLAIALVLQFGFNIAQPLAQRFPGDIAAEILRQYGEVRCDVTVTGPQVANVPTGPDAKLLLNAQHLYPVTGVKLPPDGKVLFSTRHPLQFLPYQYEGWTRRERAFLREADITIRLIDPRSID